MNKSTNTPDPKPVPFHRLEILLTLAALFLVTGPILPAADSGPPYGYDDTPFIGDSKWRVHDRKRPQPTMVDPGTAGITVQPGTPPSDAIVLFNGKDLAQWDGGKEEGIEEGCINILKTGQIHTKQKFGDCQLHIEWATGQGGRRCHALGEQRRLLPRPIRAADHRIP